MTGDEVLSLIVAVARESALLRAPEVGDLVVATEGCPFPCGKPDPDAIGYLVDHGDAAYREDGTGEVREVWDIRALSGRTHGGSLHLRWENVTFAPVSPAVAALIKAISVKELP